MQENFENCRANPRFVGDPVDVVTGAVFDIRPDFRQRGPIPLEWNRYYLSSRSSWRGSLGWGYAHEYERVLVRDLDGVRYEDPSGAIVGFQDLAIGASDIAGGMQLRRLAEDRYAVSGSSGPSYEFSFSSSTSIGLLAALSLNGHSIELQYNEVNRLLRIVDSLDRHIDLVWNEAKQIDSIVLVSSYDPQMNRVLVAYRYDRAGNLVCARDLYDTTQYFEYDAAHRLNRRTDRRGYSFVYAYDELGRCIQSQGEDGLLKVELDYRPEARTTFVKRGDGGRWIYFYDESAQITQITDPYGCATQFIQDAAGRTVKEVDPNGNVTQLHYNWLGEHDYRIDPNGYVLPTRAQDPDPPDPLAYQLPETPLEWEFGRLINRRSIKPLTNDDNVLTHYPAAIFNAFLGNKTFANHDLKDSANEPSEKAIAQDDFDRPMEQAGQDFVESWKYDPNGNEIEYRDRAGAVFRSVYGSWNALRQEIDPAGHVTAYDHNVQGLVSKVIDPGGTVTEYAYDLREKLVEVRRQGQVRESYTRDRAGKVIAKKNTAGRTLVAWEIAPGNVDKVRMLASGEQHVFKHDDRGRVVSAIAPSGEMTIAYDSDGRILEDKRDGLGVAHEFDFGQLTSTTYFDKFKVTYRTDDNGDLVITDPVGGMHRIQFSQNGLIAKTLANGCKELCQFDDSGRCLRKAVVRSSLASANWMRSYHYSQSGDLVAVADSDRGTTTYTYDSAHRLAVEVLPNGVARRFEFDAAGNLLQQPGLTDVVMAAGNRLAQANGEQFSYNDRDHICERTGPRGTTRYEYNDLDLLVRADVNGEEWTATYDPYCRRATKTWHGRTMQYYWDDFRLAAEVRHDGSVRIYVYADEVALVPFLLVEYANLDAEPSAGHRYYLFTNQVGVPIRAEDDTGKACCSARIDPFGQAQTSKDSTLEMPLRFPGHYYDQETGLHFNRFRYFSPELGRFLQSDPVGLPGGINLYAYPADPLTESDIDGLKLPGRTNRRRTPDQVEAKRNGNPDESTQSGRNAANACLRSKPPLTPAQQAAADANTARVAAAKAAKEADKKRAAEAAAARLAAQKRGATPPAGPASTKRPPPAPGLTPAQQKKLGGLAHRADEKVGDVIRDRGGSTSNVNKAGEYKDKTLREAAKDATDPKTDPAKAKKANTAIKIAKQGGRLGQKY